MNINRAFIAIFTYIIPNKITYSIYQLLFIFFKSRLKNPNSEIWYRNSLALNYMVFGLSDIDTSIWLHKRNLCKSNLKKIEKYKKLLLGGEVQYYIEPEIFNFINFANDFELRRDPVFKKKTTIHVENSIPNIEIKKVVFLLKMILSEKNVHLFFFLRNPKWKATFSIIDEDFSKITDKESLINQISNISIIKKFFNQKDLKDFLNKPTVKHHLGTILFSNQIPWCQESSETFQHIKNLTNFSPDLHEIIYFWQRWEIWGLFTYLPNILFLGTKEQLKDHINNQIYLTNLLKISQDKKDEILQGFSKLGVLTDELETQLRIKE
jgi:hypothetical protein